MFGFNFVFSKAKPAQTQTKNQNKIEPSTSKSSFEKHQQTAKYTNNTNVQEQSYLQRHSTQSRKQRKIQQLQHLIALLTKQKADLQMQKLSIKQSFDILIEQNATLKEKNLSANKQIESISCKYNQMLQKLEQNNRQLKLCRIFFGNIMREQLEAKQFLVKVIQDKIDMIVEESKLLYRQDPLNPTNFHKYIDNHPYILLLVKTKNNEIIGAFSEDPLSNENPMKGRNCFLFNLRKKNIFNANVANKQYCSMQYDTHYIIFGNYEIRIKFGQDKLFSNFGISSACFFQTNQKQPSDFLGENERQIQIQTYEIFQIIFKTVKN